MIIAFRHLRRSVIKLIALQMLSQIFRRLKALQFHVTINKTLMKRILQRYQSSEIH